MARMSLMSDADALRWMRASALGERSFAAAAELHSQEKAARVEEPEEHMDVGDLVAGMSLPEKRDLYLRLKDSMSIAAA